MLTLLISKRSRATRLVPEQRRFLSLYESDLTNRPVTQCVDWLVSEMGLNKKSRQFVSSLTTEVEERRTELDRRLNRYSKNRTMQEASPVVRNVLRTALVELEMYPKTRTAVIINEAVKLSQMFDAQGLRPVC